MSLKRKLLLVFLLVVNFIISLIVFLKILENQNSIAKIKSKKYHSYLLIHELKRNFNDLTQMARAYIATGEPRFREYFQRILDIRDGKIPRPENYHNPYWDFVLFTGQKPQKDKEPVAFWTLIEKAGFDQKNIQTLGKAEDIFKEFLYLVEKALYAMDGLYQDEKRDYTVKKKPNREMAIDILYSQEYEKIKKEFINFLKKFSSFKNKEIERDISLLHSENKYFFIFLWIIAVFVFFLALSLIFSFRRKQKPE